MESVHAFYTASICIHGDELLRQFAFHRKIQKISQMKQMFDMSEKLTTEQSDVINGMNTNSWETHGLLH